MTATPILQEMVDGGEFSNFIEIALGDDQELDQRILFKLLMTKLIEKAGSTSNIYYKGIYLSPKQLEELYMEHVEKPLTKDKLLEILKHYPYTQLIEPPKKFDELQEVIAAYSPKNDFSACYETAFISLVQLRHKAYNGNCIFVADLGNKHLDIGYYLTKDDCNTFAVGMNVIHEISLLHDFKCFSDLAAFIAHHRWLLQKHIMENLKIYEKVIIEHIGSFEKEQKHGSKRLQWKMIILRDLMFPFNKLVSEAKRLCKKYLPSNIAEEVGDKFEVLLKNFIKKEGSVSRFDKSQVHVAIANYWTIICELMEEHRKYNESLVGNFVNLWEAYTEIEHYQTMLLQKVSHQQQLLEKFGEDIEHAEELSMIFSEAVSLIESGDELCIMELLLRPKSFFTSLVGI